MLSMLNHLTEQGHDAQVNWLHAAENGAVHAFSHEIQQLMAKQKAGQSAIWFNQPRTTDRAGFDYQFQGLMDLEQVREWIEQPNMQFYFCSPVGFMQHVGKQLVSMGVDANAIHYECFTT